MAKLQVAWGDVSLFYQKEAKIASRVNHIKTILEAKLETKDPICKEV